MGKAVRRLWARVSTPVLRKWVISAVLGLALGWTSLIHFILTGAESNTIRYLGLAALTALFTPAAYWLVFRFIWPRLQSFSPRGRWLSAAGVALASAILLAAIPLQIPPQAHNVSLEIIATGQKNSLAQGSEVWILDVSRQSGPAISFSEMQADSGWEIRDNALVSHQNQPAILKWQGKVVGGLRITFISHPWSGIVTVRWQGTDTQIDLFAATSTQKIIDLPLAQGAASDAGWLVFAASLVLADFLCMALLLLSGIAFAARSADPSPIVKTRGRAWLYYALPSMLVWTVWLLALFPGLMSSDSINEWGQMLTGILNDEHSPLYTFAIWLVTRLWLSPAAVAIVQILGLSIALGFAFQRLRQLNVPAPLVWIGALAVALWPVNGAFVITLWKDIPYSIVLFCLTLLALEVVISSGRWLQSNWHLAGLALLLALAALFRYNGLAAAVGLPLVLLAAYPHLWRRFLAAIGLVGFIYLGVSGPVYSLAGVNRQPWVTLQPFIHQLAAQISAGTPFSPEDQAALDSFGLKDSAGLYSCYFLNPIIAGSNLNKNLLNTEGGQLLQVWWHGTLNNPGVALRYLQCSSSLVWRITPPGPELLYAANLWMDNQQVVTIADNPYGLQLQSYLPDLSAWLAELAANGLRSPWEWLLWRPALFLYLVAGGALIAAIRARNWKILLVLAPVLLHSAGLVLTTVNQDLRFQYPVLLAAPLLILLAFARRAPEEETGSAV